MNTPSAVFDLLQSKYGTYGDHVLLQAPYRNGGIYEAAATTLKNIELCQANGYVDESGIPRPSDCSTILWCIVDADADDESNACNWDKWDAYDSYGQHIGSNTL
jgi:hypothetical protein